jgi:hypothetical protein
MCVHWVLSFSIRSQELQTRESGRWRRTHTAKQLSEKGERLEVDGWGGHTQRGPETPYLYATPDEVNNVAAQVHEDTTAEATSPDLTVLPAVLKSSLVCSSLLYPFVVSRILRTRKVYLNLSLPPQNPSD